ncbi:MAG: hypothetical protein WC889_19900, partial [Myxococcota bacterium]|jgi:pyruvate formate lyase activating enzyme
VARDKLLPRVPLIPGITATTENLKAIAGYLKSLGFSDARLLAWNPLWRDKASAVDRLSPPVGPDRFMSREEVQQCEELFFKELNILDNKRAVE